MEDFLVKWFKRGVLVFLVVTVIIFINRCEKEDLISDNTSYAPFSSAP